MESLSKESREEQARLLRLRFSVPAVLGENGAINQEYFRSDDAVGEWNEECKDLLRAGILKYGIGAWKEIEEEFLPNWASPGGYRLRVKTERLLGRQNISSYTGLKPTSAELDRERSLNLEVGRRTGLLKDCFLVEFGDDTEFGREQDTRVREIYARLKEQQSSGGLGGRQNI